MEEAEKLIENYTEYMTLSAVPEAVIQQCSSDTGAALLKKGHEYLQSGEAEKAVECYREAAEKGEADAYFALSVCYECGIGMTADPDQADAVIKKAVELRRQDIYKMMGDGTHIDNREKTCILSPKFKDILFPPFTCKNKSGMSAVKHIVFKNKIDDRAFGRYYKDISASRDHSVIGWVENEWSEQGVESILHIEADGKVIAPVDCSDLFRDMNIDTIVWNDAFITEKAADMSYMFSGCKNLIKLELSNFNTENVKNMRAMFSGCENLSELQLNGFKTEKVTDMSYMFYECKNLSELQLNGFKTEKVTDMSYMFYECKNLIELELDSFDTGEVTDMSNMFAECEKLTGLELKSFGTGNVMDMNSMFLRCENLRELNLRGFNTKNVKDMCGMFYRCENLKKLDLSRFDTGNVTNMGFMFLHCENLTELDLGGFDTRQVTDMRSMFLECKNLRELNLSGFDTRQVTDMNYMFKGCKNLMELNISGFDFEKVRGKKDIFDGCDALPEKYKEAGKH